MKPENIDVTITMSLEEWAVIRDLVTEHDAVKSKRFDYVELGEMEKAGDLLNEIDRINDEIVVHVRKAFVFEGK